MRTSDILRDGFGRVKEAVAEVLEGAEETDLSFRPDSSANTVAWLVWHLSRVQDDHVAEVAGTEQIWVTGGWRERFDLPLPAGDTGYGHSSEHVARVVARAGDLAAYHAAVATRTDEYLQGVADEDLDRVVDRRWEPPVTLGVRLVSVLADDLQHAGQAAYVMGLARRRR
jgi:uncharacterized damage-inducible protein DinB